LIELTEGRTFGHGLVVQRVTLKRATLLVYSIGGTFAECDHFGIPSTSRWTGAAIIEQSSPTKT
jgi:hypothetical protein